MKFFKPTKGKVILFIVLSLIIPTLQHVIYEGGPARWKIKFLILDFIKYGFFDVISGKLGPLLFGYILTFIIAYLLSCLIFYIFKRK